VNSEGRESLLSLRWSHSVTASTQYVVKMGPQCKLFPAMWSYMDHNPEVNTGLPAMNRLNLARRTQTINCLVEGNSIRSDVSYQ